MASLLTLVSAHPVRTLNPGDILVAQGEGGGDLFVLERGRLAVERDGVVIATLTQPGTAVGEMSVLAGTRSSATVRAEEETRIRVVQDAAKLLVSQPELALRLGALVAGRLDATSALLVEMSTKAKGAADTGLIGRLMAALHGPRKE